MKSSERKICANEYFIKTKIIDQKIKQKSFSFHFVGDED